MLYFLDYNTSINMFRSAKHDLCFDNINYSKLTSQPNHSEKKIKNHQESSGRCEKCFPHPHKKKCKIKKKKC